MFHDLDMFRFISARDLVGGRTPPGGSDEVTFLWGPLAEVWAERGTGWGWRGSESLAVGGCDGSSASGAGPCPRAAPSMLLKQEGAPLSSCPPIPGAPVG